MPIMKVSCELFCLLVLSAVLSSCRPDLPEQAKGNEWNLRCTLAYYKYIERDTAKYAAARFLIDNMAMHYSEARIIEEDNDTLERWRMETDSIYYSWAHGLHPDSLPWDTLYKIMYARRERMEAYCLPTPVVDNRPLYDIGQLDFRFLTNHIDNAFRVWHESPFARRLSFDEFKEYILPYRCVPGYGFIENGSTFNRLYAKYLECDTAASLRTAVQCYNNAINTMRDLNGKTSRTHPSGIYDLYARDFHNCKDVASYGCNILRACGIPTVVEFNVCYRSFSGRHFQCCSYDAASRAWYTFNAESSLPGDDDWEGAETANIYRYTYSPQHDTPHFLKAEGEYVPSILRSPFLRDVTARLLPTTTVTLPFEDSTECNLAYLATYSRDWQGTIPVTWGVIDHSHGEVTFNHAMPGLLYFPIYYPDENYRAFGQPFYIEMVDGKSVIRQIPYMDDADTTRTSIILTRKYPRKPGMKRVAEELVGGRFLGSVKGDFSDAVTLYEIKEAPQPAILTYQLSHVGNYKGYCFRASEENPHAHISMLEWLTPDRHDYPNTMPAMRQHILSPSDTAIVVRQSHLMRLMDADKWEDMARINVYDGNMQTAPSAYRDIWFMLKEPQEVTHVRFSPLNADNGICAGDEYELRYWDDGWQSCGTAKAEYEYVEFEDVPRGRLYWLINMSRGKEEMPFVLDEQERQRFVYYDIMYIDK